MQTAANIAECVWLIAMMPLLVTIILISPLVPEGGRAWARRWRMPLGVCAVVAVASGLAWVSLLMARRFM